MLDGARRAAGRFGARLFAILCFAILFAYPSGHAAGEQAATSAPSGPSRETAMKAASFRAKDLKGQIVDLAELLEEGPVFLHFWTTWCPSCQREMTRLDRLHRAYRDKGFHVVAIAQDDAKTVQKIKPLVTSKKFLMTVIADSNKEIGNRYNVRQYPTCFLIAKDGAIVHYAQGYIPGDEDQLEGLVRKLLGLEPSPAGSGSAK